VLTPATGKKFSVSLPFTLKDDNLMYVMYQQSENTCESACAGGDVYPKHQSRRNPQFGEQTSSLPSLQIEEYAAEIPPAESR